MVSEDSLNEIIALPSYNHLIIILKLEVII